MFYFVSFIRKLASTGSESFGEERVAFILRLWFITGSLYSCFIHHIYPPSERLSLPVMIILCLLSTFFFLLDGKSLGVIGWLNTFWHRQIFRKRRCRQIPVYYWIVRLVRHARVWS